MFSDWRRKLRDLYPAKKLLKGKEADALNLRLPSQDEALHTKRYHPVFAVRVPASILEVTQMLSELTGRKISDVKKLIVLEGIIQLIKAPEARRERRRRRKN